MPPFARHRIETLIKEELWSQVGNNQLGFMNLTADFPFLFLLMCFKGIGLKLNNGHSFTGLSFSLIRLSRRQNNCACLHFSLNRIPKSHWTPGT